MTATFGRNLAITALFVATNAATFVASSGPETAPALAVPSYTAQHALAPAYPPVAPTVPEGDTVADPCSAAVAAMAHEVRTEGTRLRCVHESTPDAPDAVGWYNGDEDVVYVLDSLGFQYTTEVIAHELGHAWDLELGTRTFGTPTWFSEAATGFSVEDYARLYSRHVGYWPEAEEYPGVVPTDAETEAMVAAGWLPEVTS